MTLQKEEIESIEQGYFAALEWLTWESPDFFTMHEELENEPDNYDIDTDKINSLVSDIVKDFIDRVPADLIEQYLEQIKNAQYHSRNHALNLLGHDLYLTSEGHGAGFWDRGLNELGDKLTEFSKSCATIHIWYDGENNKIRGE